MLEQSHPVLRAIRDVVHQGQRPGEVGVRVGERIHPLRRPTGRDGGVQGSLLVPGAEPVPSQLARDRVRSRRAALARAETLRWLQCLGRRPVKSLPFRRHQLGVDDLAERRMPERDGVVAADLDHVLVDGRSQQRLGLLDEGSGRRGEQGHQGGAADDRRRAQYRLGVLGQGVHPGVEQLVQGRGQQRRVPRVLGRLHDELLREQRVARGSGERGLDELGIGGVAGQLAHQPGGRVVVQPAQLHAFGVLEPGQLGDPQGERCRRDHGVGAQRHEQDGALVGEVRGEEPDQVQRRPVRPVHVLDDVKDGSGGSEPVDEVEHRLEQPELGRGGEVGGSGGLGRGHAGDQPGQLRQPLELKVERPGPVEPPQRLGQRGERQGVAGHRDAGPREQGDPFLLDQLADQPGLPDAGLSGDDEHARMARGGTAHGRSEHPEGFVPPDERRGWTSHHRLMMTGPTRPRHPRFAD